MNKLTAKDAQDLLYSFHQYHLYPPIGWMCKDIPPTTKFTAAVAILIVSFCMDEDYLQDSIAKETRPTVLHALLANPYAKLKGTAYNNIKLSLSLLTNNEQNFISDSINHNSIFRPFIEQHLDEIWNITTEKYFVSIVIATKSLKGIQFAATKLGIELDITNNSSSDIMTISPFITYLDDNTLLSALYNSTDNPKSVGISNKDRVMVVAEILLRTTAVLPSSISAYLELPSFSRLYDSSQNITDSNISFISTRLSLIQEALDTAFFFVDYGVPVKVIESYFTKVHYVSYGQHATQLFFALLLECVTYEIRTITEEYIEKLLPNIVAQLPISEITYDYIINKASGHNTLSYDKILLLTEMSKEVKGIPYETLIDIIED